MKDLHSLALKVESGHLWILDQTRLPDEEVWLEGNDPAVMVGHIQRLSVRGAPLIGVAAALSLRDGRTCREVDVSKVQAELARQGVRLA